MALLGERVLLIANPGARRGEWLLEPARKAFQNAGVHADVVVTEARGHGARVAREQAANYDLVFTLGGDGTAMEVVQALMGSDRSVGILPGGTGNLLARVLRIPLDVRRAVPALLHGTRTRIDLGILGDGTAFAIGAGTGVDSEMIAATPLALRRKFGILAYVATASKSMLRMKPFSVRAIVDGRVIEREHCVAAMIVNIGSVLNGVFQLGPGISHEDGRIDLCLFSASNLLEMAVVSGRMMARSFGDMKHMAFARGQSISLETVPPRQCQADGEMIGLSPISARVAPLAAPLLVPRRHG